MYELLCRNPKARERKHKNKAVAFLLIQRYKLTQTIDQIEMIVRHANSLDREWRKILQDYPELRGKDYDEKTVLEQKKELQLGYEPQPNKKEFQRKLL